MIISHPLPTSPLPLTDLHQIWHSRKSCWHNHRWQVFLWSVKGCRFCGESSFAISHWPAQSPLTQSWRYRAAREQYGVCPSVCPISPLKQRAEGLLLWARWIGAIDRLLHDRRRSSTMPQHGAQLFAAANAGSATLYSRRRKLRSCTQTCCRCIPAAADSVRVSASVCASHCI